jgi:hypothetical protein
MSFNREFIMMIITKKPAKTIATIRNENISTAYDYNIGSHRISTTATIVINSAGTKGLNRTSHENNTYDIAYSSTDHAKASNHNKLLTILPRPHSDTAAAIAMSSGLYTPSLTNPNKAISAVRTVAILPALSTALIHNPLDGSPQKSGTKITLRMIAVSTHITTPAPTPSKAICTSRCGCSSITSPHRFDDPDALLSFMPSPLFTQFYHRKSCEKNETRIILYVSGA